MQSKQAGRTVKGVLSLCDRSVCHVSYHDCSVLESAMVSFLLFFLLSSEKMNNEQQSVVKWIFYRISTENFIGIVMTQSFLKLFLKMHFSSAFNSRRMTKYLIVFHVHPVAWLMSVWTQNFKANGDSWILFSTTIHPTTAYLADYSLIKYQ
jgi:hypothetical protein